MRMPFFAISIPPFRKSSFRNPIRDNVTSPHIQTELLNRARVLPRRVRVRASRGDRPQTNYFPESGVSTGKRPSRYLSLSEALCGLSHHGGIDQCRGRDEFRFWAAPPEVFENGFDAVFEGSGDIGQNLRLLIEGEFDRLWV